MSRYRISILQRTLAIAFIGIILVLLLDVRTVRSTQANLQPNETQTQMRPLGIALEEMDYPYPVRYLDLTNEGQPRESIRYELPVITQPTLLVIGMEDRIALGRNYVSPEIGQTMGNFPELGCFAAKTISNAKLIELPGIGHIPHHEAPEQFEKGLLEFLSS